MIKKICLVLAVVAALSVTPVYAHNGVEHETEREAAEHAAETERQSSTGNRKCPAVQATLAKQLDRSDKIKQRYLDRYQLTIDRLTNISERVTNNTNLDTKLLDDDIQSLNGEIADFETTFAQYQANLRSAVNLHCPDGGSLTELRRFIIDVRTAQRDLRQSVGGIDSYVQETVVEHLNSLAQAVADDTAANEEPANE